MIRLVRIVRNVEFAQLFDAFFITSITTILVVRFYLKITGYPQIGNSTLHISHLLPGSLLMLIAVLVLLGAVNRATRNFAAVLAGVGFGLVWDELGKFITKNKPIICTSSHLHICISICTFAHTHILHIKNIG